MRAPARLPRHSSLPQGEVVSKDEMEKYTPIHKDYLYLFLVLLLYQSSYFLFLLVLGALLLWLELGMLCHK